MKRKSYILGTTDSFSSGYGAIILVVSISFVVQNISAILFIVSMPAFPACGKFGKYVVEQGCLLQEGYDINEDMENIQEHTNVPQIAVITLI